MKLPDSLVNASFENHYQRGLLFRYLMPDPDDHSIQSRFKYGLLLNLDCAAAESYIFLSTSRIEKIEPLRSRFPDGFYDLAVGQYDWVTSPTVIDLRAYKRYPRESMLAAFQAQSLVPQCQLKPEHLAGIDTKLRLSRTIEKRVLRLIVR